MNQEYGWLDEILETSEYWLKLKNDNSFLQTVIMDPDGWDRSNYNYSFFKERISRQEFENRLMQSTCMNMFDTIVKKNN